MRAWQFRQKTPGFGISKNFYLTILAATAQLPPITQVVEPHGVSGAVEGFGVPLAETSKKDDLARPMERGAYVIASKNRQTVLRLMVVPKEEAGFDPAPFLRSSEAERLTSEHLARISATWTLLQLTLETHEAAVYGSLKFMLEVASRLAELTQGVVSDPLSQAYLLPSEVFHLPPLNDKVDVRDFVRVRHLDEGGWIYTLGMQKFSLPEFEIFGVLSNQAGLAERFLLGIAQAALLGKIPELGGFLGAKKCPFQIAPGGLDRKNWEGIACYELIPPSGCSPSQALGAWAEQTKP
jgi:hypothetical protein